MAKINKFIVDFDKVSSFNDLKTIFKYVGISFSFKEKEVPPKLQKMLILIDSYEEEIQSVQQTTPEDSSDRID